MRVRRSRPLRRGLGPRRARRTAERARRPGGLDLAALGEDRTRGAAALGADAVRSLIRWAARAELDGPSGETRLRAAAREVIRAQPAMGSFRRWAATLERLSQTSLGRRRALLRLLRSEASRLDSETDRVARRAAALLPPGASYVTLSQSATVAQTLLRARTAGTPLRVVVLESLPGGEGRAQARELRRGGILARVVKDDLAASAVADADAVVVGADAIFSDGTVWHKVGTRALAEAARRVAVPVIVIAGSSKLVPRRAPRRGPPGPFESVPRRLISVVLTEKRRLTLPHSTPPGGAGPRNRSLPQAGAATSFSGARGPARRRVA